MKFQFALLAVFWGVLVQPLTAQSLTYLGIEQGLSNNTVTSIYKDRFGFMWFGTFDGLNRYDGYTFKKFRNRIGDTTSLPNNKIRAIEGISESNLWIATDKGIGILNEKSLKFSLLRYKTTSAQQSSALLNKPVHAVKADGADNIYIGTADLGLMFFQKNASAAIQIPLPEPKLYYNYPVYALTIDKNNNVWFCTKQGLYFYNSTKRTVIHLINSVKKGSSIHIGSNGTVWIGTDSGMFLYNPKKKKLIPFEVSGADLSRSRVFDFCFDTDGKVWISTDGDGVFVVDAIRKTVLQTLKQVNSRSLSSNSVYTVFIDTDSRKWIGTLRGGINIIDPRKKCFQTIRHEPYNQNSLIHNTTMSFCEEGENIWIGTDGGGISIWNRKPDFFKHYVFNVSDRQSAGANQITSMIKDEHGNILVASYGSGVKRFNKDKQTFQNVPFVQQDNGAKYVWKLYMDADKNIWAGCIRGRRAGKLTKGMFKLDKKNDRFVSVSFPVHEEVISIVDDNSGNLWAGTINALLRINKKTGAVRKFNLNVFVRDLYVSRGGSLWIGTEGRGLLLYNYRSDTFKEFTENSGLPNNNVLNIEEDMSGNLWISTSNGLSKYNPTTQKFENFFVSDGLQSNQFYYNASLLLSTGEMLFGGIKGFNLFHPASIKVYKDFPPLMITGMRVVNRLVNAESKYIKNAKNISELTNIVLPYSESMFSLDFVALEYSFPDKIQYAYYLKGWDKAWNYTANLHSINYTHIYEGKYTLYIKSTNASGIWNSKVRIIKLTVLPPWYRSWWAVSLYIIVVFITAYVFMYYQKERTRLLYEVKLAHIKTVQEAEINEKKISFFTNIAHELRTPLTLIVNPIKELLNNTEKKISTVDVSTVYRNTRRLLSLVDQLLLFKSAENEVSDHHSETLNLVEVCKEAFLCFNNQVKERHIDYKFECSGDYLEVFEDREKIEIVLFNLLSNAIKYTPDRGSVTMILNDTPAHAEILVKDSGPGIPQEVGSKLFEKFYRVNHLPCSVKKTGFGIGLFISKVIAEKQSGTLTYSSKINEGCLFNYTLPKTMTKDVQATPGILREKSYDNQLLNELITESQELNNPHQTQVSKSMHQLYEKVIENKATVLLIDDDDELRNYIRQLLDGSYNILEGSSAEQGLEVLKIEEPDIIICDVVMPGISGVEFCAQVKNSKETNYIPVILLTGTSSPDIKLNGIECGADDYITKPFEKDLFLARIKSILKQRNSLKKYFINEVTLQNNNEKVSEEYSLFLKKCIEIVENYLQDEHFNVKVFVQEMGMSHSNVFRKVKSISGLSISEFIRYLRIKKAAELMIQTNIQVKEVAFRVGLQDIRYFREQFSKVFGLNPSDYIKKYRRTFLRTPDR